MNIIQLNLVMGLLDDIKKLEPVSNKVFTTKDLIKIFDGIFKDVEKELKALNALGFNISDVVKCYKQTGVGKFELDKIKVGDMVITFNKKNKDNISNMEKDNGNK